MEFVVSSAKLSKAASFELDELHHRVNATSGLTESQRQEQPAQLQDKDITPYAWIIHPVVDILFCCGGLVWLLFLIHFHVVGAESTTRASGILAGLATLGTFTLSETHIGATFFRLYKPPTGVKFPSLYTKWITLFALLLVGLSCAMPVLVPLMLRGYLLMIGQHFTAQTFGFVMLYCTKRQYKPSMLQRRSMQFCLGATAVNAALKQLLDPAWTTNNFQGFSLPSISLPADALSCASWLVSSTEFIVALSTLLFVISTAAIWRKTKKLIPAPALLTLFTGVSIFLVSPKMNGTLWLYAPAFFHASQYLAVSLASYLKQRGLPEGIDATEIALEVTRGPAVRYLFFLALTAGLLFHAVPFLLSQFGIPTVVASASIFCALQFHHFVTDAAIWKLRNPVIRKQLIA